MDAKPTPHVGFTDSIKAAQSRLGSRDAYARVEERGGWKTTITADLTGFIATRDSAYLATASAEGQPYIQHRGGPRGFIKVLDERTLAFADFSGNKQYISLGNLAENDRAHLFLMDYANRQRIKIWGRAKMVEDDPELVAKLADPSYTSKPERALVFTVEGWDPNCPQHITPRFTEEDFRPAFEKLQSRIAELEAELAAARGENAR
jgi:uncharacterized protein